MLLFIENGMQRNLAIGTRFNTSHVTLYLIAFLISCQDMVRFNTSHVTLYPGKRIFYRVLDTFQYISCYSLSKEECVWN